MDEDKVNHYLANLQADGGTSPGTPTGPGGSMVPASAGGIVGGITSSPWLLPGLVGGAMYYATRKPSWAVGLAALTLLLQGKKG